MYPPQHGKASQQALPGIHDGIAGDIPLHLHEATVKRGPALPIQGREDGRHWHAMGSELLTSALDIRQPRCGHVRTVDANDLAALVIAHEQVQAG